MNVLFLTNIPSPYMVNFFNEFGKRCNLTVIFERSGQGGRDQNWHQYRFEHFRGIILKGIPVMTNEVEDDAAICPQIIFYLKKRNYDCIIVANPCTPTGIIAIQYMKIRSIPYMLFSEGGFPKDGKGFKEKLKHHLMKDATLYFSTTEVNDRYFFSYGATAERIRRIPFTSLYQKDILLKPPTIEEKKYFKNKLNIKHEQIVLAIGRFLPVKGFDLLIRAKQYLPQDTGLYIIGGEPIETYQTIQATLNLEHIYYIPFLEKEQLKTYYLAADLFVFPSRGDTWGLVINEAMAHGLPVISTDRCIAAMALIEQGVNGYIVAAEEVVLLIERMNVLLGNKEMMQEMAEASLNIIQTFTFEQMAKRHYEILKEYFK
jgi:glycosyltransferase involved in cell wall biosynthesis